MKRAWVLATLISVGQIAIGATFDGYPSYYATFSNRIFTEEGISMKPLPVARSREGSVIWTTDSRDRRHHIEIREGHGIFNIDNHVVTYANVISFTGETAAPSDLDSGTAVHFAGRYACIEDTPASASGTAARHRSVYLVDLGHRAPMVWKLPTLFATCNALRWHHGKIAFDRITYRWPDDRDAPEGLRLQEFMIDGPHFTPTGFDRTATFVEPGNVYKFQVDAK